MQCAHLLLAGVTPLVVKIDCLFHSGAEPCELRVTGFGMRVVADFDTNLVCGPACIRSFEPWRVSATASPIAALSQGHCLLELDFGCEGCCFSRAAGLLIEVPGPVDVTWLSVCAPATINATTRSAYTTKRMRRVSR